MSAGIHLTQSVSVKFAITVRIHLIDAKILKIHMSLQKLPGLFSCKLCQKYSSQARVERTHEFTEYIQFKLRFEQLETQCAIHRIQSSAKQCNSKQLNNSTQYSNS